MTGTIRLTTAQALVRWLVAQRSELLDGTRGPAVPGRLRDLRARQRARARHRAARGPRGAPDLARPERAGDGARRRRPRPGHRPSPGDGGDHAPSARARSTWSRLPGWPTPTGCRCCSCPATPSPAARPTRCSSRSSTSATPRRRSTTRSAPSSRYFDRITRPEQLLSTLPQVARVLTDPADCGPVVLAMPQDAQVEEFDFPQSMFATRVHRDPAPAPRPRRPRPTRRRRCARPSGRCWSLGGGVRYSGAAAEAFAFAETHGVPVVETVAGRTLVPHDHRLYGGALGIIGATSANDLAAEADVVLAVGTRLQDFTTSSWTGVRLRRPASSRSTRPASTRSSTRPRPWSATPARRWSSSSELLGDWVADAGVGRRGLAASWPTGTPTSTSCARASLRTARSPTPRSSASSTTPADRRTTCSPLPAGCRASCTAAGAPASSSTTGRPTSGATMDLEYGFSCMGYEVVAPWGAAMARAQTHPDGLVTGALRRRLLPDAQLRALLRGVLRSPLRGGALRQLGLRGDPPAADQPGRRGVQQHAGRLARPRCRRQRARRLRRARPLAGLHRRGRARRRPESRSCGRRTTALGTAAREASVVPRSWSAGPTPPPGPRPGPGGRPACRSRSAAARRTTRPSRTSCDGCEAASDQAGRRRVRRRRTLFHTPFIAAAEGVELAGVVTRSPVRRAEVERDWPGVPVFDSLGALLASGVDAVTITTPPETRRVSRVVTRCSRCPVRRGSTF